MGHEMKHKKAVVVVLIVLACLGILQVYNAPEENSQYQNDLQGVIKAGNRYSWLLFIGNKSWLLREFDFTENTKSKLKKEEIQQIFRKDILDKYRANGGKYEGELRSMLFREPEDIELIVLERQQPYLAMTYTLKEGPTIPGKGKMLCSVAFRYYQPANGSLLERVLRKTANAVPFCSSLGTTGKWLVADYSYTYNQSDYAAWYLREGDAMSSQRREENKVLLNKLRKKEGVQEFMSEIEMDMAVSEEWASAWVERHPEHVDVQLFEAANRVRKETRLQPDERKE